VGSDSVSGTEKPEKSIPLSTIDSNLQEAPERNQAGEMPGTAGIK
jgi:hypothetical protein